MRSLVIVNPMSRSGATGRRWRRVEAQVREALGSPEVALTRRPRDAERIAREAVRAGTERLVVAGGDGTLNEVVSGLLAAELGSYAEIGVLPLGTGGDFPRTLGIPRDLEGALACIAAGKTRRIDAGRLFYRDAEGQEVRTFFCNVASFGLSALVDELTARTTHRFGGKFAFAIGTLRAIARYGSYRVAVRVDGELVFDGSIILGAVANGRHFGGGMTVGPDAEPDDGRFDVSVIPALARLALFRRLPGLYDGSYVDDPAVRCARGSVVELDAPEGTTGFDIDGDPRGMLPGRIEAMPGALSVIGADS